MQSTSRSVSLPKSRAVTPLFSAPLTADIIRTAALDQPSQEAPTYNFLCMGGMHGGRLYVPQSKMLAFLTHVSRDLDTPGSRLFLVQYVSCAKHNLFFDLDKSNVSEEDMVGIYLPVIRALVARYVPAGTDTTCFLLSARMQTVTLDPVTLQRTSNTHSPQGGFHIVFPRVVVDCVTAAILSVRLIQMLDEKHPLPDNRSWEEVVDLCLTQKTYTSLRMPGMRKVKHCDACRAGQRCPSTRDAQLVCQRIGANSRCAVPKVYVVIGVLDTKGRSRPETVTKCDNDILYTLQQCSIQSRPHALPLELENGDGEDGALFQHEAVNKAVRAKANAREPTPSAQNLARAAVHGQYVPIKRQTDADSSDVSLSVRVHDALCAVLGERCEAWGQLQFRRVVRPVGQHVLLLYPHCKYCLYAKRYHNNNIFFELTPTSFVHKCFSAKCVGHKPGKDAIELPLPSDDVLTELFPSYRGGLKSDVPAVSASQALARVMELTEQRYGKPEDKLAMTPRPLRYKPLGIDLNSVAVNVQPPPPGSAVYHDDDSHWDAIMEAEIAQHE